MVKHKNTASAVLITRIPGTGMFLTFLISTSQRNEIAPVVILSYALTNGNPALLVSDNFLRIQAANVIALLSKSLDNLLDMFLAIGLNRHLKLHIVKTAEVFELIVI